MYKAASRIRLRHFQTVFKPSRQFRTTVRPLTICMSNRYKENQMVWQFRRKFYSIEYNFTNHQQSLDIPSRIRMDMPLRIRMDIPSRIRSSQVSNDQSVLIYCSVYIPPHNIYPPHINYIPHSLHYISPSHYILYVWFPVFFYIDIKSMFPDNQLFPSGDRFRD